MSWCGTTESLVATDTQAATGYSRMVANVVNVLVTEPMVGFSRQQWEDCLLFGFRKWSEHADITFQLCTSESKALAELQQRKAAFWRIINHRFDGPSGVLADMQLAYPGVQTMRWDVSERWFFGKNRPADRIGADQTGTHEGGHGIGQPHTPAGPPAQVMDPMLQYVPLHETEIGMAVKIYGPAKKKPGETEFVPAPSSLGLSIDLGGINSQGWTINAVKLKAGDKVYIASGVAKEAKAGQLVQGGLE